MIKFCRGSLIVFLSGLLFLTLGCSNEVKGEMKIISETTETVLPTIQNELEVHVEKDFAVAFNSLEDVKNAIEMGMT